MLHDLQQYREWLDTYESMYIANDEKKSKKIKTIRSLGDLMS